MWIAEVIEDIQSVITNRNLSVDEQVPAVTKLCFFPEQNTAIQQNTTTRHRKQLLEIPMILLFSLLLARISM